MIRAFIVGFALFAGASSAMADRCIAVDGDTLVCNRQKVRLMNVYAAELNQAGGAAAKRRLQAAVQGRDVSLRPHGHDRYGRLVAEAYVGGRRIEQGDVGPRAGRGSGGHGDRQVHVRVYQAKKNAK